MNCESIMKIITEDLGMRKNCVKMVLKQLNNDQKWHIQVCQNTFKQPKIKQDLLGRFIIGDESWIFEHDPETNSLEESRVKAKEIRPVEVQVKLIFSTFFNVRGIIQSSCHRARQSISMSTNRSCSICFI